MIVTRRIAIRLALIIVVAVVLQLSFFSYLSFFGATPDALTVVVASIGLLGGAVVGSVTGFTAGFLIDAALLQTLGVSSIAMIVAGYLTGRYREASEISGRFRASIVIGAVTMLATAIFAALQIMLGVSTQVSLLVAREIFVKGLLGGLMAFGIFPLIRWLLRAALVDEPRPGRVRPRAPVTATATASRRRLRPRPKARRRPARPLTGARS